MTAQLQLVLLAGAATGSNGAGWGSAGGAAPPPFDVEPGTDHSGGDMPGACGHFPCPVAADDDAACHASCVAAPGCVGWVMNPSGAKCKFGSVPATQSACWLKSSWGIAARNDCRTSGLVREPPQTTIAASVDMANTTHRLRPLDMGCHSDTGYSHQPRNLYAQKIYGSSFEFDYRPGSGPSGQPGQPPGPFHWRADGSGWSDASVGPGNTAERVCSTAKHGLCSVQLKNAAASGRPALANRGLGNEGLFLEGGKLYQVRQASYTLLV
eukprot:SAG22_NODE_99_length_20560_cov_128.669029_17_plen_268_part_00